MADKKISIAEFATRIKTKYPDYAKIDNLTLTRKFLAKYPEYRTALDAPVPMEPLKGQEGDPGFLPTALGQAREMALESAETIVNPVSEVVQSVPAMITHPTFDPGGAVRAVKGAVMAPIERGTQIREGLEQGDSQQVARGVGGAITDIAGMAMGLKTGTGVAAGTRALAKTAAAAERLPVVGRGAAALNKVPASAIVTAPVRKGREAVEAGARLVAGKVRPIEAMTQGLKPKSTNLRFTEDLHRAMPEVKVTEEALGRPIGGVDDLAEAIPLAKKRVRAQYDEIAGPQRMAQIDASPVADAIERSVSNKVRTQNPELAAKIDKIAQTYRERPFTIEELEDFQKTTNAELDAYYGKYPAAQRSAAAANPDIAATVTEAKALRDAVYKALDAPEQGAAPRELNRRYGALLNLEREVQRRRNVALRQQPESLTEQLGKVTAAGAIAGGAADLLMGGGGSVGSIAGGLAMRKMASIIKERNTADALVRRAFENYSGRPVPVKAPVRKPPAGLLTRGTLTTPPPADASAVTAIPSEYAQRVITNPGRLLPERSEGVRLESSGRTIEVPPKGFGKQALDDLSKFLDQELRAGRMRGTLEEAWKMWRTGLYRGRDGKVRKLGEEGSIYAEPFNGSGER